jgi:hypothetical protein
MAFPPHFLALATVRVPPSVPSMEPVATAPNLQLTGEDTSADQDDCSASCLSRSKSVPANPHRAQLTTGRSGCLCYICKWSFRPDSPEKDLLAESAVWDLMFARPASVPEPGTILPKKEVVEPVRSVKHLPVSPLSMVQTISEMPDMLQSIEEEEED